MIPTATAFAVFRAVNEAAMKQTGIPIANVKLKGGKLEPVGRRLDASAKIRQRKSKRVTVAKRVPR